MLEFVPLQIMDSFLLQYHFGHVFTLLLVLSVVGVLPTGSMRALSLNLGVFGLLFVATPASMLGKTPSVFKLLGVALLVVAPLVFTISDE
jgi:hypothetical protein